MEGVSQTAIGVGVIRALHRLVDREPWIGDDLVSSQLFGDMARALAERDPAWTTDAGRLALRGHVLVRSAFAENRLHAAVARGVRQYVALGAGYDTFAYRQPDWMGGVRVFEVDAPQTQADKRVRLARAGIAMPRNVTFVPIDFETTRLDDGLAGAGFLATTPAFFSWLGVMVYLSRDAADAILRYVAGLPVGSEIALTFSPPGKEGALERRVAEIGEPLRTRVSPGELADWLHVLGFRSVTTLSPDDARRYLGERSDALTVLQRECIAAAVV